MHCTILSVNKSNDHIILSDLKAPWKKLFKGLRYLHNEFQEHCRVITETMPPFNCSSWKQSIGNQLLFLFCLVKERFGSSFSLLAVSLEVDIVAVNITGTFSAK